MKRSSLALVLSLTAVFVSGILVGGFGYRMWTSKRTSAAESRREPRRMSPDEYRQQYVSYMTKRLDLTASQVEELQAILDRTEKRFRDYDAKAKPERDAIMQQQIAEINAVLTPEQRIIHQQMIEKSAERRRRPRSRSGPPKPEEAP